MTRDAMSQLARNPWLRIVVAAAAAGFAYSDLQGDITDLREGRTSPMIDMRRDLDSVRIELRHISETTREIRHLLGRRQ